MSNRRLKVVAIVGARPQFIKHYSFEKEAIKSMDVVTIHTGQHYDENMSKVFFDQLGMNKPNYQLNLGGGSHGYQTGKMLVEIEKIILDESPDVMVVYGDTNSTLAGALVASKLHIPIAHIEAGLRSYNRSMPEEVNRVLTDHISTLLLVPSEKSVANLSKEGISEGVHIVGDIMKDLILEGIQRGFSDNKPNEEEYFYATLHRPYNVDEKNRLAEILNALSHIERDIIFTAHPRTRKRIEDFGLSDIIKNSRIKIIDPQPYFQNLSYLYHSSGLITDSGGMQKEAYWMEKPCCTIRSETEWTETLDHSANVLIFEDLSYLQQFPAKEITFDKNLYGDGATSKRIVNLVKTLG